MTENIFDLAEASEQLIATPVHSRVMEWPRNEGAAWVIGVFSDPGGPQALHRELKRSIESVFLSELSRSPQSLSEGAARPLELSVLVFSEVSNLEAATVAFGLKQTERIEDGAAIVGHFRQEAVRSLGEELEDPAAILTASITHCPAAETLDPVLRSRLDGAVWGEKPGDFAQALPQSSSNKGARAGLDILRSVEDELFAKGPETIRWIEPMVFQAVCDLVGCIAEERGYTPQWAQLEADESGNFPPPLLKIRADDGWAHVPIGTELLRWSIMPLAKGEKVAAFTEWVDKTFPARTPPAR